MIFVVIFFLGYVVEYRNKSVANDLALKYTNQPLKEIVNKTVFANPSKHFAQNPNNKGFIAYYDCSEEDVYLTGKVPDARFFGISVVPFPYYKDTVGDEFLVKELLNLDEDGYFEIVITRNKTGRNNEIGVRNFPRGTIIVRISFMNEIHRFLEFAPVISTHPGEGKKRLMGFKVQRNET